MPRHSKSKRAALIGALLLAAGVPAWSAEESDSPATPTKAAVEVTTATQSSEAEAFRWLEQLEKRHADHRRVEGTFTQIRKDEMFLEEFTSTGTFYFERPNKFRCDYTEPKENTSSHLVIGDSVVSYYPSLKQVERYRLKSEGSGVADTNYMLLAFGIDTNEIRKHFTVRDEPTTAVDRVRLVFVPKAPLEERPFKRFVLDLSERDMQPVRFEIDGDNDDHTVVKVNRISWNPRWEDDVNPDKFQLKYPPDVEILDGL